MAKSSTPNSSNYSYNIVSNRENLDETKKKIIDDIKFDLFETMKIDELMVNRNILSDSIWKNRYENGINWKNEWIPWWTIVLKDGVEIDLWNKYSDLMNEYKRLIKDKPEWYENELKKLDTKLAERITLDKWFAIEFKSEDEFDDWKNAEEEAQLAYNGLNELKDYEWKIDLVSKKKDNTDYFVIKWKQNQIAKINMALKMINKVSSMNSQEIDNLQKENDEKDKKIQDLMAQLDEAKNNKNKVDENHDEKEDNNEEENEKGNKKENNNESNENKENEKEEFLRKLKEYCPRLFEWKDKTEKSEHREENRESIEKNPLYVSRKDVENSVLASRKDSDFPIWNVEIKWTYVKLEEFDFYEEIKNEYIFAKWDSVKLAELDKKLAELIIICSPKGVAVEQRYQIQLTEEEIIAWWLVVSQDFLAKYGLAVDYFEYTNTIIEKEYQEKLENIQKIEVEMSGLTTSITELTRKINIEGHYDEKTLLEIKQKKERQKELRETLRVLLLSLASLWNNWVDKLLWKENDLLKEINELNKNKSELDINIQKLKDEIQKMIEDREGVLRDEFDEKLQSEKWITFDGHTYRYEYRQEPSRNHERKFVINWIVDWKIKRSETTDTNLLPSSDDDWKTDWKWIRKQWETLRQQYIKQNIEFFKLNDDDFKNKNSDLKKLKAKQDELNNEIANKEKELANIREQIKNKDKKRVVVESFDDGDKWAHFHDYCERNWIKRKDWKEISLIGGMDPDAIYVDKDGRELKLERITWANDDGLDNPITHYELVYYEEIKEKTRVVVEKFDDGDKWVYFHNYCEENWIKRKDWKEISLIGGMDPDAIYVDKDGKELKLERITWANDDGYDNPVTHYELVYYKESESMWKDAITQQLILIIAEEEKLEKEIEELEIRLQTEKSENIKIEIEERIKEVTQELLMVKQKIINITNITNTYKETITQHRYGIYKVRPIPIPDWKESFEMTAVLSDMWTDVFREKASLKVEEDLKAYYKSLWRWQVWSRLALFLWRWRRRKRMIRNEMNNMANTAFQTGAWYGTLNEQSQNAADRHKHELDTNMAAVNQLATVHNTQVDQLCKDYLNNVINDSQFQQQFNTIISNDANIQNILRWQNITHIWTNVLLRLQEQKALNQLILDMDAQLAQYVATWNVVHMDNMRNFVSQFIKDYQKTPAFMANFEQFVKWDLNARNQLRQYLNHQKAIMNMQITNLRMNIDILNKWKSAYQIDNKDRETWRWQRKFKLWHFMDKHPRGTAIASTAISVWIWLWTGLIASPVVAWALSLWLFGWLVWTTNAVKKWTHHTKEQNTHEKNVATDYRNEQAKIQAWQNQALNGHGWRKYKAKRQLALYDQTTQENIKLSDQITEYITNLSSKVGPLTADENNFMRCNLIEGWARLKYYRQMGHNFLASEQVDKTEKDMKRLEKAITLWLQKIWKTTNDIETNMNATNQLWTNITYAVIQNDLKASYDKSLIQFKRERRNLSLKYGFGTAIASIGVGAFFQWITHSWMWAWKDIKPTPDIPKKPGDTTSYPWWTDNFALWWDNLSNWNVYNSTKSAITWSWAPTGSEVTFNYSVWTDWTKAISTFASWPKEYALSLDFANTAKYPNLSGAQVKALQDEAAKIITDPSFVASTPSFETAELARLRALEDIEHFARGLNDSARPDLLLKFNHTGSVPGTTKYSLPERFMSWSIDITTPEIPPIPGDPWRKAVRRWRWFMGMPLFFNTFKDRKDTTDTTDQNWWRWRGQQPNQPQVNPNQPQANPNPQQHP